MQSRDLNQDLIRLTRERLIDLHKLGLLTPMVSGLPENVINGLADAIAAQDKPKKGKA